MVSPYELELLASLIHLAETDRIPLNFSTGDLSPYVREAAEAVLAVERGHPVLEYSIARLRAAGKIRAAELLDQAAGVVPSAPFDQLLAAVRSERRLRIYQAAARRVMAISTSADPVAAAEAVEAELAMAMASAAALDGRGEMMGVALEAFRALAKECEAGVESVLVPAPLPIITEATGWRRGDLHLVIGLTGVGKTALLAQSAAVAAEAGYEVHLVSAEMKLVDIAARIGGGYLVSYCDEEGQAVTVSRVARREREVAPAVYAVAEDKREVLERIFIDARSWPTLPEVLSVIHRHHAARQVDLILVDYLQLIADPSRPPTRELEVRAVAEAFAHVAKSLNCAVVVAAQKRGGEEAGNPSVRESRAPAFAAALILELERSGDDDGRSKQVPYTLRVAKSRFSGAVGRRVGLVFDRASCRFTQDSAT